MLGRYRKLGIKGDEETVRICRKALFAVFVTHEHWEGSNKVAR